jgi:hypothetical protein
MSAAEEVMEISSKWRHGCQDESVADREPHCSRGVAKIGDHVAEHTSGEVKDDLRAYKCVREYLDMT